MAPAERLKAAAQHARASHLEQIASGHAASLQRLRIKLPQDALIDALPAGKQVDGIITNTFLRHAGSQGTPVENAMRGLRKWALTRFTEAEERFLNDPTKADALATELFGGDSGDHQARAVIKKYQDTQAQMLDQFRRAGVPVTEAQNYHLPQPWEWTRIRDRETFVQDMKGWMDPEEFTTSTGARQSPEQYQHSLEESWLTIKTNGENKLADGSRKGLGGNVGARYNATRQLHFKDGASWLAAMRKYGQSDNVGGIIRNHWRNLSRDIAIAEIHGPMAGTDFAARVHRAAAKDIAAAKTEKQARAAKNNAKWALEQWDAMTRGPSPGNAHVAAWMGAIRSIMSASKLGVLASQQPSDINMASNFLKAVGLFNGHRLRDFAAGLKAQGHAAEFMRMGGAWSDSLHDATTRLGDTEVWNGVSKFMNKTVYVRSGMRAADRATTNFIAQNTYGVLGEHLASGKAFADLPPKLHDYLGRFGINDEIWNVLRKTELSSIPGGQQNVLNLARIHDIPDEALRGLAEKRVAGTSDELKARIGKLNASTEKEAGRTTARQQKLADLRDRATASIKALEAKESIRSGLAEGVAAARAEVLRAHVARAELEASNTHYLDVRDQHSRMSDAIDKVLDDDKLASTLQKFAHTVGTNGEKIGSLRAAAEARVKAAEKALADKEAAAGDKIDAKQNAADKSIAKHAKALADFTKEMQNRAARREDLLGAYRKQVGQAVKDETARIKDETLRNVLGMFEDVMHAAGRGFADSTVTERSRLQLNKFEPGTFPGEIARFLWMIRQVPIGMGMTHLWDVPKGMDGWAPRTQYVARYMAGQAIATGIAIQLKHLIAGEDPEDMTSWKYAGKVAAGAGIGPLLATLLFGSGGEQQDVWGKVLGPGAEAANTAYEMVQSGRDDLAGDKPVDGSKLASKALSFARSNTVPFMNFWYTKAAFNHMIYQQLQEAVSPGYNERVQQRLRQREVSQFWQNGQATPQRAPDFGAAVGQPTQ